MIRDVELLQSFFTAGIRFRQLDSKEHQQQESAWRKIYGHSFVPRLRHRHGAKAVDEFLREAPGQWLLVPFLSGVHGIPVQAHRQTLSAFECAGPPLELGDFCGSEFFISPPDFSWTLVRTHEDFAFGGPYFLRREWLSDAGEEI